MTERYGYDKTPTPAIDYDVSKVPPEIKKRTTWVKTKYTGEDVAEAYGQVGDIAGIYAGEAKQLAERTQIRQDAVEDQFDAIQRTATETADWGGEIIVAAGGRPTLGKRIDEIDARVEQTNILNVNQFGPVGDGIADDTQALQSAINASVGKRLLFEKPTNFYKITSSLIVPSGIELVGLNKPTMKIADDVYSNDTRTYIFDAVKVKNVLIEGFLLDGNRVNQENSNEFHHAIRLMETENVVVNTNEIEMFPGDGICLSGNGGLVSTENTNKNILITNNKIKSNGRNGISLVHCENVIITNNEINDHHAYVSTLGSGIDLEPNYGGNPWTVKNVKINNNNIYDNNVGVQLHGSPIESITVLKDVVLSDNTIVNNKHRTLEGESKDIALYYLNEDYFDTGSILITDNILGLSKNEDDMHAIWSREVNSTIVIKNNVVKNVSRPFYFISSKQLEVSNNSISNFGSMDSNVSSSIQLKSVSESVIEGNVVSDGINMSSTNRGLTVVSTTSDERNDNNIIRNNVFKTTKSDKKLSIGIYWTSNNADWDSSVGNVIEENIISGVVGSSAGVQLINVDDESNLVGLNQINRKKYWFRQVPRLLPEIKIVGTKDLGLLVNVPASGRWEHSVPFIQVKDTTHVVLTVRSPIFGLSVDHFIKDNKVFLNVRNLTSSVIETTLEFNIMLFE